jgi:hypothetical protein
MSFTVYGEHPGSGGHWEFARKTAAGAVLKAADLISNGWMGVQISDDKEQNLLARSVRSALSREQPECLRGASSGRISKEFAGGAIHRKQPNDQCTRALSTRSSVPNAHFARASGTRWAGPGSPSAKRGSLSVTTSPTA